MASRQREWQKQMIAEGKCCICAKKAFKHGRCKHHYQAALTLRRNAMRRRKGIPLDRPVKKFSPRIALTPEQIGMLGTVSDNQLARRWGCKSSQVRFQRLKLKIPRWRVTPPKSSSSGDHT